MLGYRIGLQSNLHSRRVPPEYSVTAAACSVWKKKAISLDWGSHVNWSTALSRYFKRHVCEEGVLPYGGRLNFHSHIKGTQPEVLYSEAITTLGFRLITFRTMYYPFKAECWWRSRLWTAVTNGPVVHFPCEMSMDKYGGMMSAGGNPDSSTRALWQSYRQSHLVANRRKWAKEINLAVRSIFVHASKGFLTCRKILRHGAAGFPSAQRNECCSFLLPLEIHRPRPNLNLRIFGPMASTLIITPPRTVRSVVTMWSTCFHSKYLCSFV
jgi:hypothetical protein